MRMADGPPSRSVASITSDEGTAMSKIIVGVDESPGSADAIALASGLAGITGAELLLVNVFPYDLHPSRGASPEFEAWLRSDSHALLERVRSERGVEAAAVRAVPNPSPAHGLHSAAETEDAALIVVGSTHTGRAGRVLPGSTGERLLHGAPCPVGVAPKGYAERAAREPAIVGCGYDGTRSAKHALEAAHRIAEATGAPLRVIRVFQSLVFDVPPGASAGAGASYNDTLRARAEEELEAATADLGAERIFTAGDPVKTLAEESEELDLLFVGSRGYGPLRAVVLGGVAGRLVREAACPVIVLPRTAEHVAGDSLFATAASIR